MTSEAVVSDFRFPLRVAPDMPEYPRALSYTRLTASPLTRARTPADRQPGTPERRRRGRLHTGQIHVTHTLTKKINIDEEAGKLTSTQGNFGGAYVAMSDGDV